MSESRVILNTKRVLLIDDEVNVREVVQTCLSTMAGWKILIAQSTHEGLNQAIVERPDLIILDIATGGDFSGTELLEQLQTHTVTQSIPIVLLSVEARWLNARQLQQFGVIGAIAKPFNIVTLPAQIANLLKW